MTRISELRRRLWFHLRRPFTRAAYERIAPFLVTFCLLCVPIFSAATFALQQGQSNVQAAQAAGQVQTCENANESRAAQLALWNFIFDLPPDEEPTPQEKAALADIRAWLEQLFAPRDCSDLDREYEIPPPPDLLGSDSDG